MESERRVGWWQALATLVARQRMAMLHLDVDLALAVAAQIADLVREAPSPSDLPLSPQDSARCRSIKDATAHNSQLLRSLTEPLYQLDAVARHNEVSVALDFQA